MQFRISLLLSIVLLHLLIESVNPAPMPKKKKKGGKGDDDDDVGLPVPGFSDDSEEMGKTKGSASKKMEKGADKVAAYAEKSTGVSKSAVKIMKGGVKGGSSMDPNKMKDAADDSIDAAVDAMPIPS